MDVTGAVQTFIIHVPRGGADTVDVLQRPAKDVTGIVTMGSADTVDVLQRPTGDVIGAVTMSSADTVDVLQRPTDRCQRGR